MKCSVGRLLKRFYMEQISAMNHGPRGCSMSQSDVLESLITFLDSSPTAWHAVDMISQSLDSHGFQELKLQEKWSLSLGGRYYVKHQGSTLAAFIVSKDTPEHAIILGSHTDSPGLK